MIRPEYPVAVRIKINLSLSITSLRSLISETESNSMNPNGPNILIHQHQIVCKNTCFAGWCMALILYHLGYNETKKKWLTLGNHTKTLFQEVLLTRKSNPQTAWLSIAKAHRHPTTNAVLPSGLNNRVTTISIVLGDWFAVWNRSMEYVLPSSMGL